MKQHYPEVPIGKLCELFGKTRHAWYDNNWRQQDQLLKEEIIVQLVLDIRKILPSIGTRKLLHMLHPKLQEHNFQVGRDYLFDVLTQHKLLIRKRKRKIITTNSKHWMRKYSNLIEPLQLTRAEQLWVSDITYIRLSNGFAYLSLVTDAYSRKVVGFNLHQDLSSEGCLAALQMALNTRTNLYLPLIHHSDRGCQYCCKEYIDLLTKNNIAVSMTTNGDPYQNAIAERVNGILKNEFRLYTSQHGFETTAILVQQAIAAYNNMRPHASVDYLTPQKAHEQKGLLKKRWKPYRKQSFANSQILPS